MIQGILIQYVLVTVLKMRFSKKDCRINERTIVCDSISCLIPDLEFLQHEHEMMMDKYEKSYSLLFSVKCKRYNVARAMKGLQNNGLLYHNNVPAKHVILTSSRLNIVIMESVIKMETSKYISWHYCSGSQYWCGWWDCVCPESALDVCCTGVVCARGILQNPAMFAGYSTTPLQCIQDWVSNALVVQQSIFAFIAQVYISLRTGVTFSSFHHHLMFMLEKVTTKSGMSWSNHRRLFVHWFCLFRKAHLQHTHQYTCSPRLPWRSLQLKL